MAKRRNSAPTVSNVPPSLSAPRYNPPTFSVVRPRIRPIVRLVEIEDRRTFHPMREMRPVLTFSRRDQRRIIEKSSSVARASRDPFPSLRLGFAVPQKVAVCVRRKQRREALFAFKKTGKGSRSARRYTSTSKEHC